MESDARRSSSGTAANASSEDGAKRLRAFFQFPLLYDFPIRSVRAVSSRKRAVETAGAQIPPL
jgi:hypothetical protein